MHTCAKNCVCSIKQTKKHLAMIHNVMSSSVDILQSLRNFIKSPINPYCDQLQWQYLYFNGL